MRLCIECIGPPLARMVPGTVFSDTRMGPATYLGLDHYMGQTTHKFHIGRNAHHYVLPADLAAFLTPTWKEDDSAEPVARRARTIARQGMKAWCNRPVSPEQVAVCNKLTELIMDALAAAEARALAAEGERDSALALANENWAKMLDFDRARIASEARVERAEAALRGAVTAIEWWEREHPCCRGATDDLLEAARAALAHTGE